MTKIEDEFTKVNNFLYCKTSEVVSNYIMQKCLIRNALYRATYHILLKVLFLIF